MRLLGCLFIAVWGALAQAGAPIFTNVGPLSCGMRVYAAGKVQEYCFSNSPPAPLVTICNALHQIVPATAGSALPVSASQSCFATDTQALKQYLVTWLIWQPIVAVPPGSTGVIHYQIASTVESCKLDAIGRCVSDGTPAATTMQEGDLSSGVVASIGNTGGSQLALAMSIGPEPLTVISSGGIVSAIGPRGLCLATATSPGIVGFGITSGGLKVDWLPSIWCPGGLQSAQAPTLTGDCTALDLTGSYSLDQKGMPYCTAIPTEPTRSLAQTIVP